MLAQHSRTAIGIALVSTVMLGAAGRGLAARKPARPQPKQPIVQGTQQLSGDQAQIGQTYTLGKENPINVAVTSVAYSVNRIRIGSSHYFPRAAEKLMVIQL